jgi:hypothetical protein
VTSAACTPSNTTVALSHDQCSATNLTNPPALSTCEPGVAINAGNVFICPATTPIPSNFYGDPNEIVYVMSHDEVAAAADSRGCLSDCIGVPISGWKMVVHTHMPSGKIGSGAAGPVDIGKKGAPPPGNQP